MGLAINGSKVNGVAINGSVVSGMAYNGHIIYQGTPIEWQRLSETETMYPGCKQIRPYNWEGGNRDLVFYSEIDFSSTSANPGDTSSYSVLITCYMGDDNILKLCAGDFFWEGSPTLAWVPFVDVTPVGGAQRAEVNYTVSQFSDYGQTGYTLTLDSAIPIPTFFGGYDTVLFADPGSADTYYLEIQKA